MGDGASLIIKHERNSVWAGELVRATSISLSNSWGMAKGMGNVQWVPLQLIQIISADFEVCECILYDQTPGTQVTSIQAC